MRDSFIEFEEMGMVALMGVLLVPGLIWIAKGKSTASMVRRTVIVGGAIAGAVVLEAALDRSVDGLVDPAE